MDAFFLSALLFQCLPVPFPAQSLCAWLEQSPVWGKAASGSCVSNKSTSAGLPWGFVALCNQAAPADPPSVLRRGPASPRTTGAVCTGALGVFVSRWDLMARVLCCCSCNLALEATFWGINPLQGCNRCHGCRGDSSPRTPPEG